MEMKEKKPNVINFQPYFQLMTACNSKTSDYFSLSWDNCGIYFKM